MNSKLSRTAVVALVVFAAVSLLTKTSTGAPATTVTTAPSRQYYLTKRAFQGNQALTACVSGYHFASFAELSNANSITYNKTLGRTAVDDGAGPPSLAVGWVRTGYSSNSDASDRSIPTNCNVWTSNSNTDHGEVGFFDPSVGGGTVVPVVAFSNSATCDGSGVIGVWCVQN
jgi:hypothetical protein